MKIRQELEQRILKASATQGYGITSEIVKSLSNVQIIDSYITCYCCGEKEVPTIKALKLAEQSTTAAEFFDKLDRTAKKKLSHNSN